MCRWQPQAACGLLTEELANAEHCPVCKAPASSPAAAAAAGSLAWEAAQLSGERGEMFDLEDVCGPFEV